jgi:hypothetical protein
MVLKEFIMLAYDMVKSFMELTGVVYFDDAINWLDWYDWDVEAAVKAYNKR